MVTADNIRGVNIRHIDGTIPSIRETPILDMTAHGIPYIIRCEGDKITIYKGSTKPTSANSLKLLQNLTQAIYDEMWGDKDG